MEDRVFITGGTGFVGSAVIDALLAAGYSINALVNHRAIDQKRDGIKSFMGDLFDPAALRHAMQGCSTAIHLVGIIEEKPSRGITFDRIHHQGTIQVVDAAKRAGIKRYVHMSALGAEPNAVSQYHRTKYLAEQYVRHSGLDWTILQPSMIHGPRGDFSRMEANWARGKSIPFFFMPYFAHGVLGFGGSSKIQPMFVEDVAIAFAQSIVKPNTIGEIFPIGGPEKMTWPHMHHLAGEIIAGRHRRTLGIPAWYAKVITYIVPPPLLPFTRDQVLMSQQDNTCDLSKFISAYGWSPRPFAETLRQYAGCL